MGRSTGIPQMATSAVIIARQGDGTGRISGLFMLPTTSYVDTPPARLSGPLSRVDGPEGSRAPGLSSWLARPFDLSMDMLSPRLLAPTLLDP